MKTFNNLKNTSQLKCNDCDQIFDESLGHCPNCGCPASACQKLEEDSESACWQPYGNSYGDGSFVTTDTGDKYEKTIKIYAKVVWIVSIVLSVASVVGGLVLMLNTHGVGTEEVFLYLLVSLVGIQLFLLLVYVFRAFIMVIHNISINLHEINMKIK